MLDVHSATVVALKVVLVTLYGPAGEMTTHTNLDDGSQHTLLSASNLQLSQTSRQGGASQHWRLPGDPVIEQGTSLELQVSPTSEPNERLTFNNVFSIQELDLPAQHVDYRFTQNGWDHLDNLPLVCAETS